MYFYCYFGFKWYWMSFFFNMFSKDRKDFNSYVLVNFFGEGFFKRIKFSGRIGMLVFKGILVWGYFFDF